jgi:ElaB/YqjD/DUF883 family membrane-anchored ribosome-binding protein
MAYTTTHSSSDLGRAARDKAGELRDKASDSIDKMADKVESTVSSMAERGREVSEDVHKVAGNLKSAVDTSLKEQPMATLAVAAAVGFVLGALWKT